MDEQTAVAIEVAQIASDRVTLRITDWSGVVHEVVLRRGDTADVRGLLEVTPEGPFVA